MNVAVILLMKQYSIFQLLGFVVIVAALLAAGGSAILVRSQGKEIARLNALLDQNHESQQHFVSMLIQCHTDDRFLWIAPRLKAMAGNELRAHGTHLELTPELEQITLLEISARVYDIETVEKYGREKLGEKVLVIYNEDKNQVIDAMFTSDLDGGSRCSDGWELHIPDAQSTTIATPTGFKIIEQGDAG